MKRILLTILMGIFLINLASSIIICIDLDPPSLMNSSLTLTASGDNIQLYNIQLSWTPATDIPDCSGIDYYDIWVSTNGINFSLIANTSDTTYTDTSLSYGNTYYYMIHVFDLAGHNEGEEALSNSLYLSSPSGPTPPGGGGGGGSSSYWECGEWSECINETQERVCEDVMGTFFNRTETRECFPEFIPTGEGKETEEIITETTPPGFFAGITGGVIGTLGTGGTIVAIIVLIIIVIGSIIIVSRKKK